MIRNLIPALTALGLAVLAIATWSSLGSGVCLFCLIMMGAALLYKRFLLHREDNPFDQE